MKKEILEALKTRFEGVSESILGRIADKLAKTVTKSEDVAAAVEKVTFQEILTNYGDSRATEATQTAVKNYEQKHNLKDGKPVEQNGGGSGEQNEPEEKDVPAWAKAIIESNKKLTEQIDAINREKTSSSRKQVLATITANLPEKLRKAYDRTPVDTLSEDEFNALQEEIKGEVAEIEAGMNTGKGAFGAPLAHQSGGTGGGKTSPKEASDKEVESVMERMGI